MICSLLLFRKPEIRGKSAVLLFVVDLDEEAEFLVEIQVSKFHADVRLLAVQPGIAAGKFLVLLKHFAELVAGDQGDVVHARAVLLEPGLVRAVGNRLDQLKLKAPDIAEEYKLTEKQTTNQRDT